MVVMMIVNRPMAIQSLNRAAQEFGCFSELQRCFAADSIKDNLISIDIFIL
jgi:hypothetical protein